MVQVDPDATRDTTTTTGTGPFAVSGAAMTGYHTFSDKLSVGDTFTGYIRHRTANEFQYGTFTYSAANEVTTLVVDGGSNGTSAVSFSAGTKDVVAGLVAAEGIDGGTF